MKGLTFTRRTTITAPLEKVIVALDFEEVERAYRIVEALGGQINWYKIGPALFTRSGQEILSFLHKRSKRIFLDLKLHDTPNVVAQTVKQIADMGVELTTVHCLGGRKMLQAASLSCRSSQLKLLGITLLTSHHHSEGKSLGWVEKDSCIVLNLLELALESRLAGILCSPHDLCEVRRRIVPGFLTVTAGIRLPQEEVFQDDQERVASPSQALEWGSDYLIIGRPITLSPEPNKVLQRLF